MCSGGVLLSHTLPGAVPSPCQVLTSGFGMGPGVSPGPWPPQDYTRLTQDCSVMPGDGLGTGQGRGVVRVMRFGTSSCIVRGCRDVPPPGVGVCVSRRPVSTGRLHPSRGFHVRPIYHVFSMGPTEAGASRSPYLEEGFPLRCFQRLSHPDVANRPCHWRDNRHTRGPYTPVLSY